MQIFKCHLFRLLWVFLKQKIGEESLQNARAIKYTFSSLVSSKLCICTYLVACTHSAIVQYAKNKYQATFKNGRGNKFQTWGQVFAFFSLNYIYEYYFGWDKKNNTSLLNLDYYYFSYFDKEGADRQTRQDRLSVQ